MKIALGEDSVLLREGLVSLLERFGHDVIVDAENAPSLVTGVENAINTGQRPDIVITDVRMPPGHTDDGLQAALTIRSRHPELPIMVLSQYIASAYIHELLQDDKGGVGYLLKDRIGRVRTFLQALDTVAEGGVVVDPEIVRHLSSGRSDTSPLSSLSERELTVLGQMAEGESNADIAKYLHVSEAAIAKHIGNIFAKLNLQPNEANKRVRAILMYLRAREETRKI